jgi:hypothetical protein
MADHRKLPVVVEYADTAGNDGDVRFWSFVGVTKGQTAVRAESTAEWLVLETARPGRPFRVEPITLVGAN